VNYISHLGCFIIIVRNQLLLQVSEVPTPSPVIASHTDPNLPHIQIILEFKIQKPGDFFKNIYKFSINIVYNMVCYNQTEISNAGSGVLDSFFLFFYLL
jgi:hypothetical protein